MTADRRVALATLLIGTIFLCPGQLHSYFTPAASDAGGVVASRGTPVTFSGSAAPSLLVASAQGSLVAIGKGCTTVWYIDEDCDGYGPGVRSSGSYAYNQPGLGDRPDADDTSASLNTFASVASAFGSGGTLSNAQLKAFLSQRKGITADNIFYISPTGNNATGAPDNPNQPYASYNGLRTRLDPGDVVVFRAGTYVNHTAGGGAGLVSGTSNEPVVIMTMPGEVVRMESNSGGVFDTSYNTSWNIIDGFTFDNPTNTGLGTGWSCAFAQNVTFRNLETQRFNYVSCVEGHDNLTIERSLFHHQSEHGFYMGANTTESTNITLQDNIFYANGYDHSTGTLSVSYGGYQYNGRCTGCLWQRNISHTNSGWGFSLIQGVHNSTIRNNLIFNNGTYGIIMQIYPGACAITGSGEGDICPYDTNNNLFINNTIWVGTHRGDGRYGSGIYPEPFAAIGIARNTTQCVENGVSAPAASCTMEQTFRNNVFYTTNGQIFRFEQSAGDAWLQNSVFEKNVVYKTGNSTIATAGSTAYTFAQFESNFGGTNLNANPLFVGANTSDYGSPGIFNFRLQTGSPARDFGTATGAPADDLTRTTRLLPPDAGSYEYAGGGSTISAPQAPTNVRIIR